MRVVRSMAFALLLGGCDAFAPRTPEDPTTDPVVFEQPDTPERVIDNLVRAVAAKDASAYRRSLADAFAFAPTPDALARYPVWSGWDRTAEETAFRALVAAAQSGAAYSLRLTNRTPQSVSDAEYVVTAAYVLSVPHTRPDAPTLVQGRLRWTVRRGGDGLWSLAAWTDEPDGAAAAWSDLKATFVR